MASQTPASDFETVLQDALAELQKNYDEGNPQVIFRLLKFREEPYRARVEHFFTHQCFQELKKAAVQIQHRFNIANFVLFDACVRAIARWGNPALTDLLIREFVYVSATFHGEPPDKVERNYELNLVAGTIAQALVALKYSEDVSALDTFLKEYGSTYGGEEFVMKVLYAKWVIGNAGDDALKFIKDPQNKRGLIFAACAIADLDFKQAASDIEKILPSLHNPITREVFKEVLQRLAHQNGVPNPPDQITRLFGEVTPTEMALGVETDNQFVMRARAATQNKGLGSVYEVDDAAKPDR